MKPKRTKSILLVIITLLLLTPLTFAAAAINGNSRTEYVAHLELRHIEDGFHIDETKRIRDLVLVSAKNSMSVNGKGPIALADLEIPDGMIIVAYGFIIRSDGVPSQYMAMVSNEESEESISRIHEEAREWLRTEKSVRRPLERSLQELSFMGITAIAATPSSAQWVEIGLSTNTFAHNPHGQYTNHSRVFRLQNDGTSVHNFYAVRQWLTTTPGIVAYGSAWHNLWAYPRQDWGWGQLGAEMTDRDPLGTISGSRTIEVSLTGGNSGITATLGWSYTQPNVTTYDLSVLSPPVATWRQSFNTWAARTTSGGMEPGSAVRTIQPVAGSGIRRLLQQRATVWYLIPEMLVEGFQHNINWSVTY